MTVIMNSSTDEDQLAEAIVEIMPTGNVRRRRFYGLAAAELSLYMITCYAIVIAWSRFGGPSVFFGLMVALSLFAMNTLTGVYKREVYVVHIRRLVRSGLAHTATTILLGIGFTLYFEQQKAIHYLLGMVLLSYVITNTLRPVLVEIIRAGNENEQRRQPAKSVS